MDTGTDNGPECRTAFHGIRRKTGHGLARRFRLRFRLPERNRHHQRPLGSKRIYAASCQRENRPGVQARITRIQNDGGPFRFSERAAAIYTCEVRSINSAR